MLALRLIVVAAALVACAHANVGDESFSVFELTRRLSDMQAQLTDLQDRAEARREKTKKATDSLAAAVEIVSQATPAINRIDQAVSDIGRVKGRAAALGGTLDLSISSVKASIQAGIAEVKRDGASQINRIRDDIDDLQDDVKDAIRFEISDLEDDVDSVEDSMRRAKDTALDNAATEVDGAITTAKANMDRDIAKSQTSLDQLNGKAITIKQCASMRQLYDTKTGICRNAVWEKFWGDSWGGENGYVPNRFMTFTKWRDDTDLRITYHDNMRVHGNNWCRAAWYVEIDRKGCTDPGQISFDKYNHLQHNYWMNYHVGGSAHGVCRSTSAGRIKAGAHKIEVRLYTQRCDTYTGHNGQGGYFVVEEIMTQKQTN